ncbi:MAG: hypothetical protein ABIR96_04200, partial [Bdellovibrionota bacterium]
MKALRILLGLMLVSSAWAEDKKPAESFPFEDFPDFDASADKNKGANQDATSDLPTEDPVNPKVGAKKMAKKAEDEEAERPAPADDTGENSDTS